MAGSQSKANSKQQRINAPHYRRQYIKTFFNKLKRIKRSSGTKEADRYHQEYYPVAVKKSLSARKGS